MSQDERGRCPGPDVWEGEMSSGENVRFPLIKGPVEPETSERHVVSCRCCIRYSVRWLSTREQ